MQRWWERWPGLLPLELAALDDAGIPYTLDQSAWNAGGVILHLAPIVEGSPLLLTAIFPDFYPYVRPEVLAPTLDLPRHQHPESRSLCLIGRSTANWRPGRTLAQHLEAQLPKLLSTISNPQTIDGSLIEEQQGEPFSDYYRYADNCILLIDSQWRIPPDIRAGYLEIGIDFAGDGARGLQQVRGAVLSLHDEHGRTLAEAHPSNRRLFSRTITGRWHQVSRPIPIQGRFPSECAAPRFQAVGAAQIDIVAFVFPEEVRLNTMGHGWVFVVTVKRPAFGVAHARRYFVRAGRAGVADVTARIPELKGLGEATVAVIGLGALGAPSALELARAGVAELRILDFDFVDPAASVRWPFGAASAGLLKTDALDEVIRKNYPYTAVRKVNHRLGAAGISREPGKSDLEVMERLLDGADLVLDATAELGLQHLLADLCQDSSIPYLSIWATEGAWGGFNLRVRPGETPGCWMCAQHAIDDQTLPMAPADSAATLQPVGCANPTFTGSAFDLAEVWLGGVRLAVATICRGIDGGYPDYDWDIARVALRDAAGRPIPPRWDTFSLNRHPACDACRRRAA